MERNVQTNAEKQKAYRQRKEEDARNTEEHILRLQEMLEQRAQVISQQENIIVDLRAQAHWASGGACGFEAPFGPALINY